ncbi:MAG: hypothetical protein VXX91_03990 [Planctomycetota bacterium]|nr:hypothetical protein [Planctomycetota bacterium]
MGAGKKEKEGSPKSSSGGVSTSDAQKLSKDLTRQIGEADKKGDKKTVQLLMKAKGDVDATIKARGNAVAPAPSKTTKKDPVKNIQNEQKKTKDFLKEDNKRIAKENPGLAQKSLQAKNKKLGEEYERLRGDKSPQATARREKIMKEVSKNMSKIKDIDKKEAAKNVSRDSSPAGARRRSNAAMNAKD